MRKHMKLIVSLVLVSSVALAGAISVEVGGFQYLKGLVLTAPSGTALTITDGACIRLAPDLFLASVGGSFLRPSATCGGASNATLQIGTLSVGGAVTASAASGSNAFAVGNVGARISHGGGPYSESDGTTVTFSGPIKSASTLTRGTITLSGGTGTATVLASAICACTDTTANASVKCTVAVTTLTATGTGSDVIAYICL